MLGTVIRELRQQHVGFVQVLDHEMHSTRSAGGGRGPRPGPDLDPELYDPHSATTVSRSSPKVYTPFAAATWSFAPLPHPTSTTVSRGRRGVAGGATGRATVRFRSRTACGSSAIQDGTLVVCEGITKLSHASQ